MMSERLCTLKWKQWEIVKKKLEHFGFKIRVADSSSIFITVPDSFTNTKSSEAIVREIINEVLNPKEKVEFT